MIRTLIAAALALTLVTPAVAGNPEPVQADPVVVPQEEPKDDNWVLPILAIVLFAAGMNN